MNLYTVILEFNGGTYVSQNSAENELSALIFWANNPGDEMLAELGFLGSRNQWITEIVSAIENNTRACRHLSHVSAQAR